MYTSQELVNRIKEVSKSKNILIKTLLTECQLNVNTLNQLSEKKGLSSFSLARIADYLDCSVDYLLGRTDVPEVNKRDEEVTVYKVAARGGEKEIKLNAAQRAELERIINEHKDDDNSDLV